MVKTNHNKMYSFILFIIENFFNPSKSFTYCGTVYYRSKLCLLSDPDAFKESF